MSEYLDRLKHLRDSKTPVGETASVQTNVSFRKAIGHIEKLEQRVDQVETALINAQNQERYLLARLKEADGQQLPDELFNGFSVLKNLDPRATRRTGPENISDVLDSVVRMIRARLKQ